MSVRKNLTSILSALAVGVLSMFIFQMITPFLELSYLSYIDMQGSDEYHEALKNSILVNAYYVASWSLTVFLPAFMATWLSKHHRRLTGHICGGIFYMIILVNPEMIKDQFPIYLLFVIIGAIALILPAKLLKAT